MQTTGATNSDDLRELLYICYSDDTILTMNMSSQIGGRAHTSSGRGFWFDPGPDDSSYGQ